MLQETKNYIHENKLLQDGQKVFVAFSSGVDSLVLAHLLLTLNYKVEIVHCQFGLRGTESEQDEAFARQFALHNNIPIHVKSFSTKAYAEERKVSIQMAARELRYTWFHHLIQENPGAYFAVAHHLDDQVETQLLNLIRGTSFAGLRGMKNKRNFIIRPLLWAQRSQIVNYAQQVGLQWREDSSNKSTKYKRNFIRHKITPLLEKLNPNYRQAFSKLSKHASWAEKSLEEKLFFFQKKCISVKEADIKIYLMKWPLLSESEYFLLPFLKKYQFTKDQIQSLFKNYPPKIGSQRVSNTHVLAVERDHWSVRPLPSNVSEWEFEIQNDKGSFQNPYFELEWETFYQAPFPPISKDHNTATLSIPTTENRLSLRIWKEGDKFMPLGMKTYKKVSDYYTDEKKTRFQKETTPLLLVNQEIAWICGERISEKFKFQEPTKKMILVKFKDLRT
jgi:tRNA(Ile)-lysidine synthase